MPQDSYPPRKPGDVRRLSPGEHMPFNARTRRPKESWGTRQKKQTETAGDRKKKKNSKKKVRITDELTLLSVSRTVLLVTCIRGRALSNRTLSCCKPDEIHSKFR